MKHNKSQDGGGCRPQSTQQDFLLTAPGLNSEGDKMNMDDIKKMLQILGIVGIWIRKRKILVKNPLILVLPFRCQKKSLMNDTSLDEEDYSYVLIKRYWMIAEHYFIKIAAWIHIPKLLIELYNPHFLWHVGSTIGHMLKIDYTTSIHSRGRFVRLYQIFFTCGKYGHQINQCSETVVDQADS
ncbi:hypothetical protein Ahy_B03g065977 [Arachis hypogaea]|uniref:Uncharacterized protein n=1 Tax=Arachis hypogaea TaxID=3818 RepID=A0A445A2S3_ARAHY|nr:hypothetical protein Ahy_B03g065977 [Arachis hypogaea]